MNSHKNKIGTQIPEYVYMYPTVKACTVNKNYIIHEQYINTFQSPNPAAAAAPAHS